MKKIFFFYIFFSFLPLSAQLVQENTFQNAVLNFAKQIQMLPQEKIHVQTDKSYYITGEKMFFRVFLVDAMYHIPVSVSSYVYVEMINPLGEVVSRLKVRVDEKMYFGQFDLDEKLPEGFYKIRAYTHFMRNLDDAYFFSKNIYVADPNSSKIKIEPDFHFEGAQVFLSLRLADLNANPENFPEEIALSVNNGAAQQVKQKAGAYNLSFKLARDSKQRIMLLETTYRGYLYKKFFHIPYPDEQFHVAFFPEGGQLLDKTNCTVAFKAVNSEGWGESVTGEIFDDENKPVTSFRSVYLGMGLLQLNLDAGKNYYAVCENEKGIRFKTELPTAYKNTCALKINQVRGQLYVSVNRTSDFSGQLYLLLHSRGNLLYAAAWNAADSHLLFNLNELSSGVHHFILLDSHCRPISERLVFINNSDQAELIFNTNKTSYHAREKVLATLTLKSGDASLPGNFSVAVTDDNEVDTDSTNNILTNLLLTSELKGNIENPAAYFNRSDSKAGLKLDMLMLTQGWRRYNIPAVLSGNFISPSFEVERSQKISGMVQSGLLLTPVEKAQVAAASSNNTFADITETDEHGRFVFDKLDLPDSTSVLVQALSKKGSDRMVLTCDEDTFPSVSISDYPRRIVQKEILDKYIRKEEQKYNYEKGMRLIHLDDIVVTAKRKEETRSAYTAYAEHSLTFDEIGNAGGLTIRKLLDRVGSVDVAADGTVSIRGKNPIMLLVNDVETDLEYLDDIDPYDVLRIDVLQSTVAFGTRSLNGVVSISIKSLEGIAAKKRFNMQNIMPLGYHRPVEFYSPAYDTPAEKESRTPDLRTTIFWKPDVVTDENGNAGFCFYTADQASSYTILIEGVSESGQVLHYKTKITNK